MTSHINYMTVNETPYGFTSDKRTKATRREQLSELIYPIIGTLGAIYQLYLLLFG